MTLQEFDGIMGQIQIRYQVAVNEEDGTRSIVDAEDNFTMKWNEQRIYLMNYERNANEVFDGGHQSFSGKKILLGITNDNKVRTMKSPKSKYVAFKTASPNRIRRKEALGMTLFSYEIFDAVARQGSFNKAAQQLHLTSLSNPTSLTTSNVSLKSSSVSPGNPTIISVVKDTPGILS